MRGISRAAPSLLLYLLVATAPKVSAKPKTALEAACLNRTASLEALVRDGAARVSGGQLPPPGLDGFEPPRATGGAVSGRVMATVTRGLKETQFNGHPLAPAKDDIERVAAIARELDTFQENLKLLNPGKRLPPPILGIWIDRRVPTRQALSFIEALGAKYKLGLLAIEKEAPRPSFPPHVSLRLSRIQSVSDPALKLPLAARAMKDALGSCQAAQRAWEADMEGVMRIQQALITGVKSCSCLGVDLDLLEALIVTANELPRVYFRRLELRGRAKATITLKNEDTVQDLFDRIPDRAGPVAVRWE